MPRVWDGPVQGQQVTEVNIVTKLLEEVLGPFLLGLREILTPLLEKR